MKKLAFFFLILMYCQKTVSQDQYMADSLIQIVKELDDTDTTKLRYWIWISQNQNDPDLRLAYAEKLLAEAKRLNHHNYLHHAYLQIGQAYRLKGEFDSSIEALFKSQEFAMKANYSKGVAGASTALGDVYSMLGNVSEAIGFYKTSIATDPDSTLKAVTLINLGDTYYMAEMYDSALICFEESKLIYEMMENDPSGLAYNLGNIGLVLAELGNLIEAEKNIGNAIIAFEKLGDHYASSIFLGYMADVYLEKDLLNKATSFADSSLRIGKRFDLKTEVRDNLLRLSKISAVQGEFEAAYEYHQEFVKWKDDISNDEVYSRIESLESAFELAQKQAEVDLLVQQKKNQQSVLIMAAVIIAAFIVLVFVIYSYYRSKARVNKILEDQKTSLERLNETKDKFFSIISHDLRGPINSLMGVSKLIRFFVKKNDTDQLLEMADHMETSVERLTNLLDNLLGWAMQQQGHFPNVPEKVNLNEMVEEVVGMFSNMAESKEISVETNMQEVIYLWVDRNTTHTILRNLLNNSIKFTPDHGEITIHTEVHSDSVAIIIHDTGVGIPKEKLNNLFGLSAQKSTYGTSGEKGLGLGLQLVYEFVEMNGGSIKVESEEHQGSTFTIELPIFETEKSSVPTG